MSLPREAALRRFTLAWTISIAVKLAALGLFVYLLTHYLGGSA